MNKATYLSTLESYLQRISEAEKKDIMQDFEEHFTIGLMEGKSEEEIAAALGSPQLIAKELLANYHLEQATTKTSTGNMFRAVWATIGLSFFNLIVVLGPFLALASIIFSGWVTGGTLMIAPILAAFKYIIFPPSFELFELFLSIAMSGLGIFILLGMYYATKYAYKGFIHYLAFNAKVVKGGLKNA